MAAAAVCDTDGEFAPVKCLVEPWDVDLPYWTDVPEEPADSPVDPESLSDFDLVFHTRDLAAAVHAANARLLDAVALLVRRCSEFPQAITAEIACALNVSRPVADRLAHSAVRLARLQGTKAMFAAGEISLQHVQAIAEETGGLSDSEQLAAVEDLVLRKASRQTHGQFRTTVAKAVAAIDPEAFAARREQRRRDNSNVTSESFGDGMANAFAVGTVEQIATIQTGVDAWASRYAATLPDTTAGQRRVAALVSWAEGFLTGGQAPRRHGRPVLVDVIVQASTLLGADDRPAEVVGYGPIPAQAARELAADSVLRRLIVDDRTGGLLDCGTKRYVPDQKTRDFLLARERFSGFPGSTNPASRCDIDHTLNYQYGGPTNPTNTGPFDRRAHTVKTRGYWTARREPKTGAVIWTSPCGHTYRVEPHDYRLGP